MYRSMIKLMKSSTVLKNAMGKFKEMCQITLQMCNDAWDAFTRCDAKQAREVIARDDEVDDLHIAVRELTFKYLAGMPVGGNVPLVLTLTDVSSNVERIADHAVNLAESATILCLAPTQAHLLKSLGEVKNLAVGMFEESIEAMEKNDEELARKIVSDRKKLRGLTKEISKKAVKTEDIGPRELVEIILTTRDFARIGARAENIAETVLEPYPERA